MLPTIYTLLLFVQDAEPTEKDFESLRAADKEAWATHGRVF